MSAYELKLSPETLDILKNFAQINNSMAFKKGSHLATISESRTVFAKAEIPEEIPIDFCIYDLSQLLGIMSLPTLVDGTAVMQEGGKFMALVGTGGAKAKYHFTDKDFVTAPEKDVVMPDADIELVIPSDVMESFKRASASFGLKKVLFRSKGQQVQMVGTTNDAEYANDYIVILKTVPDDEANPTFEYGFVEENFSKLMGGTYDVKLSGQGIGEFSNRDINVTYYIGIENG